MLTEFQGQPDQDWWTQNGFGGEPVQTSFVNQSPTKAPVPTGQPDPNNPGYDTGGYILGSTMDAQGRITIPNPTTGQTATVQTQNGVLVPNQQGQFASFAPSKAGGQNTTAPALGGAPGPPHIAPFSYAAWQGGDFAPPTAEEAANSPGYADALKQAQQALARSAAANGTLLTGGTAKALEQQAVSYANQNYQNVFNNKLTKYNSDLSTYQQGLVNALQTYAFNAGLTQQEYQNLLQQYGLNVANTNNANQLGYQYDVLNSSNINAANQLGFGYAGLYSNILGNGANQYGNYLTQGANANAAGSVAAGNAWANGLGGVGQTALYTGLLGNRLGNKTPAQVGLGYTPQGQVY